MSNKRIKELQAEIDKLRKEQHETRVVAFRDWLVKKLGRLPKPGDKLHFNISCFKHCDKNKYKFKKKVIVATMLDTKDINKRFWGMEKRSDIMEGLIVDTSNKTPKILLQVLPFKAGREYEGYSCHSPIYPCKTGRTMSKSELDRLGSLRFAEKDS